MWTGGASHSATGHTPFLGANTVIVGHAVSAAKPALEDAALVVVMGTVALEKEVVVMTVLAEVREGMTEVKGGR